MKASMMFFVMLLAMIMVPCMNASAAGVNNNGSQQQSGKNRTVHGTVIDADGLPLVGVPVSIGNGSVGTVTDINGNYSLSIPTEKTTLKFTYVGMDTQYVEVEAGDRVVTKNVAMVASNVLDGVMVTGYQTISRERATGSYDILNQKNLDKPSVSIAERLVGTVAGVATSLDADGNVSLAIRGQGTLMANASPLLVVDGFPIEGGLSSLNPNDIESISVLKDAAAASIWGARASNGVVVVTTKKAHNKGLKVEFSTSVKVGSKTDLDYLRNYASSAEAVEYEKSIFGKYGNTAINHSTSFNNFKTQQAWRVTSAGTIYNYFKNGEATEAEYNDALALLSRLDNTSQIEDNLLQRPVYQQYNLSLSGSSERMDNYVSFMYNHDSSRFQETGKKNFQFNYRGAAKLYKWLDLNLAATVNYADSRNNGVSASDIRELAPYDLLIDDEGNRTDLSHYKHYTPLVFEMVPLTQFPYDWSYNPITEMKNRDLRTKAMTARLQAGLTFKIMEGLTFDSKIQYERIQSNTRNLYGEETFYVRDLINTNCSWNNGQTVTQNLPSGSILNESKAVYENYSFRNQASFARTFNDVHDVNVVAGIEISQYKTNTTYNAPSYGYDDAHLTVGNIAATSYKNWIGNTVSPSYKNSYGYHLDRYFSAFGNISYTYNDLYTASVSLRTDASNFITDDSSYRYSPFWSVGLSWNMHKEKFMQDVTFIDQLRPRVTYGSNGNSDSSTSTTPLIALEGYNEFSGELLASVSSKGNPTLRWEKTYTTNIGVDFSMWNHKLFGKIDYYSKQGKDIFGKVTIPMVNGSRLETFNNAEVSNKGVEIMLGSSLDITKDLHWNGSLTFAYNKSKVKSLYNNSLAYYDMVKGGSNFHVEGYAMSPIFSYVYGGVQNISKNEANPVMKPVVNLVDGEVMPFGGTTTLDGRDFLTYQGTTVAPYNIGMTHEFSYKDFDLSFTLVGKFGHKFRSTTFNYAGRGAIPNKLYKEVLNGSIAPMPLQENDNLNDWSMAQYMDYTVLNANHVRMQELTLSYNLPRNVLSRIGMNRLTFYVQGNNLFTIKANDEDPEFRYGNLRLQSSWTFGLKLGF